MEDKKPKEKKKGQEGDWFQLQGELAVDVYQTNGEIVVLAPAAGVKPEDLEVMVENDTIRIKGSREKPKEREAPNYLIQECYWGQFGREIILPFEVDGSRAQATSRDGVLIIRLPKMEKRQTIKVKSD